MPAPTESRPPIDLHLLALTDPDLDRLWLCVRVCRQTMAADPTAAELTEDLAGLERMLAGVGVKP